MSSKCIQVSSIEELKERVEKYKGEKRYKWKDFKFKKPDSKGISSNDHSEFFVIYRGNHIETFSLDVMTIDKIKQKLEQIEHEDPDSMEEWLA